MFTHALNITMDSEVVIIGGGPAGLSTALELALAGIKVLVCERASFPIDKPCGEGMMPQGVHHLRRLGVMAHLDASQMSPFDGICLVNERGARASMRFDPLHGMGIRRQALSKALYARALELTNITLWPKTRVLGLERGLKSLVLKSERGHISTRLVIGADGLRSAVRSWAHLEDKDRGYRRYGLRKHFRIRPWSSQVEVYFAPGLEAYITPCGPEQTNVTLLWTKNPKLVPRFDHLIKSFPALCKRIEGAQSLSEERATGPLQHRCLSPIADGIALVGDASGYLDAITGEGNSIAMSEAQALAHTVVQALRSPNRVLSKKQLAPYARAHRAIVSHYYRNTKAMLFMAKYPMLMERFIEWGARYPKAFAWVIASSRAPAERELVRQFTTRSVELSSG